MDLTDDPASVIRHPISGGVAEGEDMKPPGAGWMRKRKRERRGQASPVILLGLVSPPFLINSIGSLHDGSELSESRRPWGGILACFDRSPREAIDGHRHRRHAPHPEAPSRNVRYPTQVVED